MPWDATQLQQKYLGQRVNFKHKLDLGVFTAALNCGFLRCDTVFRTEDMKIETKYSFKALVSIYKTTRCHNREGCNGIVKPILVIFHFT
jgi:hypothetical protein